MKECRRVLVVEDDEILRAEIAGALEDEGHAVVQSASTEEATSHLLRQEAFALVITDLKLPDGSGLDVLRKARSRWPDGPVLVMTAYASVDTAVEAMRLGAFHYLQKPLSVETLLAEVEKALEHGAILREREALRERLSSEQGLGRILGESPPVARLRAMISKVAKTDSTVLITGETGTGKELVANALHYESPRASGPLVKVNCAALPESLLESELFGHEKGAFTGAEKRRAGKFERADGGTLFLDEISEMGAHVQAKLLRVLQGEEFERVGGDEPVRVDVRVIAATNRSPEEAVEEGRLRKDLLYRLDIVRMEVPPLRERQGDVPLLAESFASTYSSKLGKNIKGISEDVLQIFARHDWPGNVRELENAVERAVVLVHGETIGAGDLPQSITGKDEAPAPEAGTLNLQEVEKRTIVQALEESGWTKARAAEKLGIFPSSLHKKMKRLGVPLKRLG